jgi:hypothetical protein
MTQQGGRRRIIGTMDHGERLTVTETAERMTDAASAFLAALTTGQRELVRFAFGGERRDWSFLPAQDRDGLPIGALDGGQRRLGHELIAAGTSMPGYTKVVSVMAMEHVLRALLPGLVQGPTLLIEHDNTQGNGNHIHSAWRNPADDFGDDVLAEHYRLHHA